MADVRTEYYDKPESNSRKARWWVDDGDIAGADMYNTVRAIEDDQAIFRNAAMRFARMYRNISLMGVSSSAVRLVENQIGIPVTMNVSRSMINTLSSKICKNRPKATYLVSGGTREASEKARKLEQFSSGLFYQEGVYQKTPRAFKHSLIFGNGVMKVMASPFEKRVLIEPVVPFNLHVDTIEGAEGCPRNMYQTNYVDRGVLMQMYPDSEEAIANNTTPDTTLQDIYFTLLGYSGLDQSDLLRVDEGWHLPSSPKAGDGRRVVTCGGVTLANVEWKHDFFPFAFLRWEESYLGFDGMGLCEELAGIQLEINRLMRKIQVAFDLLANPYVFLQKNSGVGRSQIRNVPGTIIEHNGQTPMVYTPQTVHPEVFGHLDRLYQKAYEISGVSQMTASGRIEPGLQESGRAMLVHNDIQSERFAGAQRRWEQFHMDIDELSVRAAMDIRGYTVRVWGESDDTEELNFKRDIDLKEDQWTRKVYPTSLLADTPEGKLATVERMTKAGYINDPETALDMLDDPDVTKYTKRKLAGKRLVEKILERILKTGRYEPPEPQMNLPMAMATAQEVYLEARLYDQPNRNLILRWMGQCKTLIKPPAPPPQQAPAAGPPEAAPLVAPPAMPAPPGGPAISPVAA